jgi:putative flavoprotein involved in K+ transport
MYVKAMPKRLSPAVERGRLDAIGVERVPRVGGVRDGRPLLADGRLLGVANVIWCTGFTPGLDWIELPVFDAGGHVLHKRGVTEVPGLYVLGLGFLYAYSSMMIQGVGRDAAYIADRVRERREAIARASA